MTAATTATVAPPRRRLLRPRVVLWSALVLGVTVLSVLVAGGRGANQLPLDPSNPEGGGLQALERVLEQQGVQVEVVRGLPALLDAPAGPGTTVLVVGTALLSPESGSSLLEHTRGAAGVVLLSPDDNTRAVLDLPVTVSARDSQADLAAGCDLPLLRAGELVSGTDRQIMLNGPGEARDAATVCLPPSAGFDAGGSRTGSLVVLPATGGHAPVTLLGIAPALTNDGILRADNAAVGLRVLGAQPRLLWYVPQISDGAGGTTRSLLDVLPPAVLPSAALLLLALVALALWQGRRLGPVVTEPLPAVIRSVETTQARSRLYRRADDRSRALAALQLESRRRLARRLGLPPGTPATVVVAAVSAASGRPAEQVRRLLDDTRAPDDETLVRVAREGRALEDALSSGTAGETETPRRTAAHDDTQQPRRGPEQT